MNRLADSTSDDPTNTPGADALGGLAVVAATPMHVAVPPRDTPPDTVLLQAALGDLAPGLGAETQRLLAAEMERVTLPSGAVLLRQGDPADCLYFTVSGRLRVYWERDDGGQVEVAEVGPGDTIGEMALLTARPRSASVAALQDSQLLRLSRAGFDHLVIAAPRAMGDFTRVVIERQSRDTRVRSVLRRLGGAPLATVEECAEITATPNLVLRNLKITQMYHRLSLQLALLLGHQDANWCTFACNASKTAGYSIRGEELPLYGLYLRARRRPRVKRWLAPVEGSLQGLGLARRFDQVVDAVSESISAGNLKVFAELGPLFARFVHSFYHEAQPDQRRLEKFLAQLAPGPTERGGQELLRLALTRYHQAAYEVRPKRRSELILLGNIYVGLHEQTRLQPHIVEALDAPLRVGLGGIVSENPVVAALPGAVRRVVQRGLSPLQRQVSRASARAFRALLTRSMMRLRLPYGEVRLGADVPRLPNEQMFPDVLRDLEDRDLLEVVRRFDPSIDTLSGSRASDWGDLHDRMNFIVDLFRSRQKSLELFDQPFDLDQRMEMAEERVPSGRL